MVASEHLGHAAGEVRGGGQGGVAHVGHPNLDAMSRRIRSDGRCIPAQARHRGAAHTGGLQFSSGVEGLTDGVIEPRTERNIRKGRGAGFVADHGLEGAAGRSAAAALHRAFGVVVVSHRARLAVEVLSVEGHLTIRIFSRNAGVERHGSVDRELNDSVSAFRDFGEGQRVVVMDFIFRLGVDLVPHPGGVVSPLEAIGHVAERISSLNDIGAVRSIRSSDNLIEVRAAFGGVHGQQAVDLLSIGPIEVSVDVEVDTRTAVGSHGEGILSGLFVHAEVAVVVEEVDQDDFDVFVTIVVEVEVVRLHPSAVGAFDEEAVDAFTHAVGRQGVQTFLIGVVSVSVNHGSAHRKFRFLSSIFRSNNPS